MCQCSCCLNVVADDVYVDVSNLMMMSMLMFLDVVAVCSMSVYDDLDVVVVAVVIMSELLIVNDDVDEC